MNEAPVRKLASAENVFAIVDIYGGSMDSAMRDGLPPVLIVHGTNDQLVPYRSSLALAGQLKDRGVYSNFLTLKGIGHDYKNDKAFELVVETAVHFLSNVMSRPEAAWLPEQSNIEGVSGDSFELKLPEAYAGPASFASGNVAGTAASSALGSVAGTAVDTAVDIVADSIADSVVGIGGGPAVALPEGWSLEPREGAGRTLRVRIPPGLERGHRTISVSTDPDDGAPRSFSIDVHVVDPLEGSYRTYYDEGDRTVKTSLTVVNRSSKPFGGTLRVRYAEAGGGEERTFETRVERLEPKESETYTIPEAVAGLRTLEAVDEDGGWIQRSEDDRNALLVHRVREPIRIDGKLDEWKDQPRFETDTVRDPARQGEGDIGDYGYLSWDDRYLYLAVEAIDDVHSQPGGGFDSWNGDGVQFAVGIANADDSDPAVYSEMGAALGDGGEPLKWRWIAPPGFAADGSVAMEEAIVREETKTVYELAVPWEELTRDPDLVRQGLKLKFSLLVNDNDGGGREGWAEYNGGIGTAKDVHAFGDVFLLP